MQEENRMSVTVKTHKRRWPMIVGISIGGVIGVLALIVLFVPTIVSCGMVKNKIINNMEASLNRKVRIDDINMSWSSGLDIKNITIEERDGLPGDTFVKVSRIFCNIDFLPLIKKQIRINSFLIESPEIVLRKDKDGVFNYEDIGQPVKPTPSPGIVEKPEAVSDRKGKPDEKKKHTPLAIPALLSDIRIKAKITNGKFAFIDHTREEETIISDLNTTLDIDSLNKPIEFKSAFDIKAKDETEHADISLGVSLAKNGIIDLGNARGVFSMKTGFTQITADFDMARFMGEGGSGLDFSMNIDLEKLTRILAGMLGLPEGVRVEGAISSKITAAGQLEKIIGVNGSTEITNLGISGGPLANNPIRQPSIKLVQSADIDIANDKVTIYKIGLDSNVMEMFIAGLATDLKSTRDLNFKIFLNVDLTKLTSEIRGLLPEETAIEGRVQSNINLKGRQNILKVTGITDIKDLYAKMGAIGPVKEPNINITQDVVYDLQNSDLEIRNLSMNTSFAEVKTSGTVINKREINLNMLLASNIERLTQSLQGIVSLPEGLSLDGKIAAEIKANGSLEDELKLEGTTILRGISATGGPLEKNRISNLDLKLIHTLDYKIKEDSVNIKQMDITSDFLNMKSKGLIASLSKEQNIDYELSLDMNLEKTMSQFAGMFPPDVSMAGKGMVDLGVHGKLSAQENESLYKQLDLNGNISMDRVKYDAYEIKDFKTALLMDDGFFTTKDFAFKLNEGTGSLSASADLKEEKPPLVFDLKLSEVRINQNMGLLAYIVPVLAARDGKISGKLNMAFSAKGKGLSWQDDLSKNLNGQGDINITDGYINGGMITGQIFETVGMKKEYAFDSITTKFVISDSKISNDDISVNGRDFNIGLSGWTSFDGRLEYSADAETLSKHVGSDVRKVLGSLGKGSKIPIVITGTVNKPKLAFKMPKPEEIGNILKGFLGTPVNDPKQETERTETQAQPETGRATEATKETQPEREEKENTVDKLLKRLFK